MRAVFQVQTIDRATGKESWVRVEAANKEAARESVVALGEVVGEVRLSEVSAEQGPSGPPTVTGRCPTCGGERWKGGRSFLVWLGVVLLFPLGLLFLLVHPRWTCRDCGYSFDSFARPAGVAGTASPVYRILALLLLAVLLVVVAMMVLDYAQGL